MNEYSIGVDLGGTNLRAAAVDREGRILEKISVDTNFEGGRDAVIGDIVDSVNQLKRNLSSLRLAGVGIGVPGFILLKQGFITNSNNLPYLENYPVRDAIEQKLGTPIILENDANAAALGEKWMGAGREVNDMVLLTLGTGVGGAVLSDGRLLRGARGRAGHFGHVSLDPDGPRSITGMPGALEMQFGDCTVAERSGGRFSTTAALVSAHRAGDAAATAVWRRSVRALACALGGAINAVDPELIVLGGGIAQAGEALFAPLAEEMERCEWRPGGARVPIVAATLGEWAGAIGAARNAFLQADLYS